MTLQRTNNNPLTAERKRDLKKLHDTIDALRDRLNIAVVYAGNKREEDAVVNITRNTRPWKSYEVVANDICTALVRLGFKNTITLKEDIHLIDALRRNNIHMVWLNTAGVQGHNPTAHAPCVLEMAGIPYVGHNPLLSTILDNKHCFKRELISYGLPTPRYMVWDMTRGHLQPDINFRFRVNFKDYKGPFVVKPVSGRASLGVEIVDHVKDLSAAVTGVYQRAQNYVIIEEFMEGKEYCVSVCSNIVVKAGELVWCDAPFVFSEIERRFEEGERIFTSMDVRQLMRRAPDFWTQKKIQKLLVFFAQLPPMCFWILIYRLSFALTCGQTRTTISVS